MDKTEVLTEALKNTHIETQTEIAKAAGDAKTEGVPDDVPSTTVITEGSKKDKATAMHEYKSKAAQRKLKLTLQPRIPSATYCDLEYSAHIIPKPLARDLVHVFPGGGITLQSISISISDAIDISIENDIPVVPDIRDTPVNIIIPVLQHSRIPLLNFGADEEKEKDRLLQKFFEWVILLKMGIEAKDSDAWVDCTDPASGRAHIGAAGSGFSDVEGICQVDTYPTEMAGVCRIMRHPTWGASVYPTLVFAHARWAAVKEALDELNGVGKKDDNEIEI